MPIRAARTLRRHRPPRAAATPRVLARRRREIAARVGRTRKLPARSSHPRSRRGTPRPALASRYAVAPPGRPRAPPARPAPPPPAHAATAAARPPDAPWPAPHNALRGRAGRPLRAAAGAPATRARRPPGSGCAGPAPAPRCYPAAGRSLPGAAGCPGDNAAGRRRRTGESARLRHGPAATPPPARARPARLRGAGDRAACSAKPGPAAPPALPANPRGYRRSRRTGRRDGLRWPAPRWRNRVPRAAPGETPEPVRGEARAIRREPARPAPGGRARRPGRD